MKRSLVFGKVLFCACAALGAGLLFAQQDGAQPAAAGLAEGIDGGSQARRGRPDPFAPLRPEVVAKAVVAKEKPAEPEPKQAPETDIAAIMVKGIMWSPQNPVAFINDRFVGVNQSVSGWRVVEIQRDRVVLQSAGRQETLMIQRPDFTGESAPATD